MRTGQTKIILKLIKMDIWSLPTLPKTNKANIECAIVVAQASFNLWRENQNPFKCIKSGIMRQIDQTFTHTHTHLHTKTKQRRRRRIGPFRFRSPWISLIVCNIHIQQVAHRDDNRNLVFFCRYCCCSSSSSASASLALIERWHYRHQFIWLNIFSAGSSDRRIFSFLASTFL